MYISFPKIVRVQFEHELYDLPRTAVQTQRRMYGMRRIILGLLVYFTIHGYDIHPYYTHMGRICRISLSTAAVENQKTVKFTGVRPHASIIIAESGASCRIVRTLSMTPLPSALTVRWRGVHTALSTPNHCISSVFGKCTLITAYGQNLLMST